MNIGRAIRISRLASGLSQQVLAEKAEISASYLSLLESGARDPSISVLRDVAGGLGMSLDVLLLLSIDYDELKMGDSTNVATILERLVALLTTSDGAAR